LMESLPAYMVPAAITTLDQFPLTPNGKLNRKKLPEPAAVVTVAADRDDVQEVSLTQDEQSLAAIWAGILGFDMIEPEDNFFDIGGHSLQAVQVIGQIKKQCGVRVRPTDLMYQTLRQLAVACANSKPDADADTAESSTGGLKGVVGKLKSLVRNGE
jgi:acyl carrier protein